MNPLLPNMWILKLKSRNSGSQRVIIVQSVTISTRICKKMNKLYIKI